MKEVRLDDEESETLVDVIDLHLEGIEDAKQTTTVDPTIEDADQLLDLMSGYEMTADTLKGIRKKLSDG